MAFRLHRSPNSGGSPPASSVLRDDRRRALIGAFARHRPFRKDRFSPRQVLARAGTALASTAVVTFALLYVVAPSSGALTLLARDSGSAPPGSVVLYGVVQNGSQPIEGARVVVSSSSGDHENGRGQVVAQESTDAQGTYRLQIFVMPGLYTVEVSLANGTLHRDFQVRLSDSASSETGGMQAGPARLGNSEARGVLAHQNGPGRGASNQGGAASGSGGFRPGNHFGIVADQQMLSLVPGVSYDVSAQLTTSRLLSFLPVTSY